MGDISIRLIGPSPAEPREYHSDQLAIVDSKVNEVNNFSYDFWGFGHLSGNGKNGKDKEERDSYFFGVSSVFFRGQI